MTLKGQCVYVLRQVLAVEAEGVAPGRDEAAMLHPAASFGSSLAKRSCSFAMVHQHWFLHHRPCSC